MKIKYRNSEYSLERDSHSFVLNKLGVNNKTKEETKIPLGYYTNLESAIQALFDKHVLDKSETQSLLDCIKNTREELKVLCRGVV